MKKIVFTVTNDLNYDQRMIRICTSLSAAGYEITLTGAGKKTSPPLVTRPFRQKRIPVFFKKGFLFYAEYNCRLFFYLLRLKTDVICSIDIDTILPGLLASGLRKKKRIYDAHEYFSEQKEIVTRPLVHRIWNSIEKICIPRFPYGYTVSHSIAATFYALYGVQYAVIRNMPFPKPFVATKAAEPVILYQGAVNKARGLEFLIPAMKQINARLVIYGDGNFMHQTASLIQYLQLENKIFLKGKALPEELDAITYQAYLGVNLVENTGLNQYYSLANKFFDYVQAGIPQVTMNFPEYKKLNGLYEVALLIDDVQVSAIADGINALLTDPVLYERLRKNCLKARTEWNWQQEEKKLLAFYDDLLQN